MTDPRDDAADVVNPDLELITDYLSGQLPAAAVAEVERRLEEDAEFRRYVAPLIAAWQVPPRWQRHPMPRAELQRSWDDFTRRAGFAHQRRKARKRRTIIFIASVAVLAASALFYQDPIRDAYRDMRDYTALPDSGREMTLATGARVRLEKGARARIRRFEKDTNIVLVKLDGAARFTLDSKWKRATPLPGGIVVITRNASVTTNGGVFTVASRGDTTELEIIDRKWDAGKAMGAPMSLIVPEQALMSTPEGSIDAHIIVRSGEKAGMYGRTLRKTRELSFPHLDPANIGKLARP